MSVSAPPESKMLGKKLYSASGHVFGTIRYMAWKDKSSPDIKLWLQTGPTIDDGYYLPSEELVVRRGRLTLRNYYQTWVDGMPLYR